MQLDKFLETVEVRHQSRINLYKKKSHDYATEDVLSGFKRAGLVIDTLRIKELPGPLCYSFTLIILKLDRWINLLLTGNKPENESIDDTVTDCHNYLDLADAVSKDEKS